jgi:lactoylglutathione lyase
MTFTRSCQRLMDNGVRSTGRRAMAHMAFVRTPDEYFDRAAAGRRSLPAAEPWASMPNVGSW